MEKNLDKVVDMMNSSIKLAANLSEPKKDIQKPRTDDNSNNASTGSQSVNVVLDAGKKKDPKPVEKHIHEFPDGRPLTEQECELALKKAQMDYELKKSEQVYFQKASDRDWQHHLEVEKKCERKRKIRNVILGVLATFGVGSIAYSFYADYRDNKNKATAPKALPETSNITTEGTVE